MTFRRSASYGLGFTALFLAVVAILTGSPALFYMGTAVIAWIGGARLQAYFATKNLEIDRLMPDHAMVGEMVKIEWIIKSKSKFRCPLILLYDMIPRRLEAKALSPSLPVAPNIRTLVHSRYQFRPGRRGVYQWSGATVVGIDAVGIAAVAKEYKTSVARLEVWPRPISTPILLPIQAGNGRIDQGYGKEKGGLEARSIRDYVPGDSVRHIHWRSTAKYGKLLVKEFETGAAINASILIQQDGQNLSRIIAEDRLDNACGKAAYLADELLKGGLTATFPQFEDKSNIDWNNRLPQVFRLLTAISVETHADFAEDIKSAVQSVGLQTLYLFLSSPTVSIQSEIMKACANGCQAIVYLPEVQTEEDQSMVNTFGHSLNARGCKAIWPSNPKSSQPFIQVPKDESRSEAAGEK